VRGRDQQRACAVRPDSGGGEVGETATPAFAANDGPETTRRTVRVCRFLKHEKKSACVFLYAGGVKVSKKIREYEMCAYELLEFFIVSHEEGRYELACPPPVDVRRGHRGAGPKVLGDVLEWMFITAGPSTKLFTWGGGGVWEDMSYERRRAEACVD
jgi:hypothetical protein